MIGYIKKCIIIPNCIEYCKKKCIRSTRLLFTRYHEWIVISDRSRKINILAAYNSIVYYKYSIKTGLDLRILTPEENDQIRPSENEFKKIPSKKFR